MFCNSTNSSGNTSTSTARSSSSSHITCGGLPHSQTTSNSTTNRGLGGGVCLSSSTISTKANLGSGLFRSRSVTNARLDHVTDAPTSTNPDGGAGLGARFNLSKTRGLETLDTLFGRGWSLDGNTGIISVSDASFLRITNPDPIEKWYILDPEPIARGQFAVVYRCQHRVSGLEYAAKFSSRRRQGAEASRDIKHEVALGVMLCDCHRTVRLHDVFATDAHVVLLMEYAPGGDLQTVIDENVVPYERDVIGFLRKVLQGLACIHDLDIVHLDIKPQNLVLMGDFPECGVKLCDFGVSRLISPPHQVRQVLGTADYVAPEIIHYEPITTKTDMWSLGVLTYVLLTGFLPFGGETDQETFLEISRVNLDFPEELFEDISAHAINFIQCLLVRCPSQRLSAIECLEHPWMKAELKSIVPAIMTLPIDPNDVMMALPEQAPQLSKSSTLPNTPTANWNILDDWAELSANYTNNNNSAFANNSLTQGIAIPGSNINHNNNGMTPTIMSPVCMTPTILTPLSLSPRDNTIFLPQRSYASYRPASSVHSSTHSLYRGNSRQNIDRLKSMSKSREVLVERLQNSSQKKTVSRSRERLHDGHLSLTKSREYLFSNRSISHSVEELPPYGFINQEEEIYRSMNSVFMLPLLPQMGEESFSTKLYKSLASIEKIDEVACESQDSHSRTSSFNTPLSVNSMTDDEYSNYLARFYPVVRSKTEEPQRELGRTSFLGGRNSESCDRHYTKENRQPITPRQQPLARRTKTESPYVSRNNIQRKKREVESTTKKNIKKLQKDKPKPKSQVNEKLEKKNGPSLSRNNSSEKRRGSVSHIEQRIQERHERMQERNEKQKKIDKKQQQRNAIAKEKQRRHSEENDKSKHLQKNKDNSSSAAAARRNSFPARKQPNIIKKKLDSQSTTPATSLESVKEIKSPPKYTRSSSNLTPRNIEQSRALEKTVRQEPPQRSSTPVASKVESSDVKPQHNVVRSSSESRADMDEAYGSLEEPVDDGIFSRSESMDSTSTIGSDCTLHAQGSSSDTLDTTFQDLLISESGGSTPTITTSESESMTSPPITRRVRPNTLEIPTRACSKSSEKLNEHLTIIREVDDDEFKSKIFTRSVSTSSDIGSMLSEGSDLAFEEYQRKISLTKESSPELSLDPKSRNRSNSIQNSASVPAMPFKLSRSNSVHLDTPLSGVARPWGEVCQGSVFRALTMFRQQSTESSSSGSSTSSRRRSSNWSTAEGLDQIIEKIKSDEEESNLDITVAPLFKISDFSQQSRIPAPPPLPCELDLEREHVLPRGNMNSTSPCSETKCATNQLTGSSSTCVSTKSSTPPPPPPLPNSSPAKLKEVSCGCPVLSKSRLPVRPSSIPIRTNF